MSIATYEKENKCALLKVKKIEDTSEFLCLKDKWDVLLSQSRTNSIFLSWEWLYTWWLVYKDTRNLCIFTVEDGDGNLLGIAPFVSRRVRFLFNSLTVLEFLGTGERKNEKVCSEFLDFIIQKDREEEIMDILLNYLISNSSKWDIINLESVLDNSCIVKYASFFKSIQTLRLWKYPDDIGGYNYLVLPESWNAYIKSKKIKFRKEIKRIKKYMPKYGNVNVRICEDEVSLNEDMERFIRLHQMRWNSVGKPGRFSCEKFSHFHKRLAPLLLRKGRLLLLSVEINGQLQICEYGFGYNQNLFIYQTGYNPFFPKKAGLGFFSMSYLIEYAITQGFNEIDFLRGEGFHKDRWSRNKHSCFNLTIIRKGIKAKLYILMKAMEQRLKYLIKTMLRYTKERMGHKYA